MPVVAVTQEQIPDLVGNLRDVYEITFTVASRPGAFTELVDVTGLVVEEARERLLLRVAQINEIYAVPT